MNSLRKLTITLICLISFANSMCRRSGVPKNVKEGALQKIPEITVKSCPKEYIKQAKNYALISVFAIRSIWNIIECFSFSNVIYLPYISSCEDGRIKERSTKITINNEIREASERDYILCKHGHNLIDGKIYIIGDGVIFSETWMIQTSEYMKRYILLKNGSVKSSPLATQVFSHTIRNLSIYSFTDFSSVISKKISFLQGIMMISPNSIYYKGEYREYTPRDKSYYSINFRDLKAEFNAGEGHFAVRSESEFSIVSPGVCGNFKFRANNIKISPLSAFSDDPCGYEGEIYLNEYTINISDQIIQIDDEKLFCFELFE